MELDQEIRDKAIPYDGRIPDDWEFIGMAENQWNYFRYYKSAAGRYYFTMQRKRSQFRFKYEVREEDGNLYAKKILPKKQAVKRGYR